MESSQFDLSVIGGGIIGAGIARDAALRGMRTLLVEKHDLGSGTTAGSTRLIHGGLRYLEMLDFGLVRMDLRERETLLRIAPHLVKPLRFFLPYYGKNWFYRTKMRIGLGLYDLLSYDKSLPNRSNVTRDQVIAAEPALLQERLYGASTYYDAQVNMPERLCLENALDASRHGATILRDAEVVGLVRDNGHVAGLQVQIAGGPVVEYRTSVVINASGPWLNELAGRIQPQSPTKIRTTKGIHLAVEPLNREAWVLFSPIDGRLFFAIPWMGMSWLGTTDTDYQGDPGVAAATPQDVEYVLRSVEHYFPSVRQQRVCYTNAGVRALVMQEGKESSVSRSHKIDDNTSDGLAGLITVLGGKITGYRAIAEEATDLAAKKLRVSKRCLTAQRPLPGGADAGDVSAWMSEAQQAGIPAESAAYLRDFYGARAKDLLALVREDPAMARPLADDSPEIAAQVRLAVREEFCLHLDDFLVRRTSLSFRPDRGQTAAEAVANILARELNWDASAQIDEWSRWERYLGRTAPGGVS
jgi:glycerol-3-phosphate dehydrogenase